MSTSWTVEIDSTIPAPRLFKAAFVDWHNLAPKVAPEKIVSAAPVSGEGAVGSIRQFNFAPGGPFSVVKERLDFIDIEKCEVKSTLVEGGGLGVHVESASTHVKVEPKAGGSVVKVTGYYKPLPGVNEAEETEQAKGTFTKVIKGCEAYLAANPDVYD
ncbi:hypothetical protein LUZ62_029764 [Rhynchospora pubera]|uniref:Bet v I/Major latex protein domain-containing protein n=1 Tax=Rhynchospora pubera TaxID=906938 RepID=A0AAV8HH59_9POAL|nr:hypothetical protein LUZ62_074864 [Rhynchospora pubera]KAJ4817198.1 hypothetical protein LUZ62_029764 [Rhynchospora pubera]